MTFAIINTSKACTELVEVSLIDIQYSIKKKPALLSQLLNVPRVGLEPTRVLPHWCLRPTRLPIPPPGPVFLIERKNSEKNQIQLLNNILSL